MDGQASTLTDLEARSAGPETERIGDNVGGIIADGSNGRPYDRLASCGENGSEHFASGATEPKGFGLKNPRIEGQNEQLAPGEGAHLAVCYGHINDRRGL